MSRLRTGFAALCIGCSVTGALAAPGQPPYPVEITDDGRELTCYTQVGFTIDEDLEFSDATGSFGATVSSEQTGFEAFASVNANQDSTMSPVHFAGKGSTSASSFAGNLATNYMEARSVYLVSFTVHEAVTYQLSGEFSGSSSSSQSESRVSVDLYAYPPYEGVFSQGIVTDENADAIVFDTSGVLLPGTYELVITCESRVIESEDEVASAVASYSFEMSLGDRDGDGLLDIWETDGIDANGDGVIDLDLAALGANPDRKDLFVEIDAMVGRAPDASVLPDVIAAFAASPVTNPNGSTGITLHAAVDESDLPLTDFPNAFAEFDALKAIRYGSPAQRANPNWANIKIAREWVYRYCIFGNTYSGGTSSGLAERPGDDFMVTLGGWPTPGGTPNQQAGTFMHELGHTLGLRHSGGLDRNASNNLVSRNKKPNYYSVMNYTWQTRKSPYASSWRLDYSRSRLPTLRESMLDEEIGLLGIGPEYTTAWTPYYDANGQIRYARFAAGTSADWDGDGSIETADVSVDIDMDEFATPGDCLNGHDDWSVLWYHLSGSANFGTGDRDELPIEQTLADHLEMEAYPPQPAACAGNVNSDDQVNLADLNLVLANFGQATSNGDTNGDAFIDLADLNAVLANFGQDCP